jgi:non-heme chloroperoxidase
VWCAQRHKEQYEWKVDAARIVPISASGRRTAKLIQDARLVVVKDGPHCITWTHADEVNRELVNFLG